MDTFKIYLGYFRKLNNGTSVHVALIRCPFMLDIMHPKPGLSPPETGKSLYDIYCDDAMLNRCVKVLILLIVG
jgi:hypothetical protein